MTGDTTEKPLYFSSADGGIEHAVKPAEFDASLVYNLLFEEPGLLMPDISFFNCAFLREHVRGAEHGLFAEALRRGLITPAFRTPGTRTFDDALTIIGVEQIHGIEPDFDARGFAHLLDNAYTAVPIEDRKVLEWPENMGGAFEEVIREELQRDRIELVEDREVALWMATAGWRDDVIETAKRATAARGGLGIRRAEIWNALGWQLRVLDRKKAFPKPSNLINEVADRYRDKKLLERVNFFVDVVNVCYQKSQALNFRAHQNVPRSISRNAKAVIPSINIAARSEPIGYFFETKVNLPRVSHLLQMDCRNLLSVRKHGSAVAYFTCRREWIDDPTNPTKRSNLKKAASTYAGEIVKWSGGQPVQQRISIGLRVFIGATTTMVTKAAEDLYLDTLPTAYKLVGMGIVGAAVSSIDVLAELVSANRRHNVRVVSDIEFNV